MYIIESTDITDDMIVAGTNITEPAINEVEWVNATLYTVGQEVIRKSTHRIYKCADEHTSSMSLLPEDTPDKWVDMGPTQRYAPFDEYISTKTMNLEQVTYVLKPGFFNTLALFGLVGDYYEITLKNKTGGDVIWSRSGSLIEDPAGWYEYLFLYHQLGTIDRLFFTGLPIRPDAELTITITAASDEFAGIGMIVLGDLQPLVPDEALWGGVQYGAKAEPVTYSYLKTQEDGTVKIVRRHSSTDLRCTVMLPRKYADRAVEILSKKLDRPLAWIAIDQEKVPGYKGLNVFGIATSSSVSYDSFNTASIELSIRGMI